MVAGIGPVRWPNCGLVNLRSKERQPELPDRTWNRASGAVIFASKLLGLISSGRAAVSSETGARQRVSLPRKS